MKKLLAIILVFFSFVLVSFSQSPMDIYNKYKDVKGVETVIINKELFDMAKEMQFEVQEEAKNVIEGLDNMIVVSVPSINIIDEVNVDNYDELMNFKDGDEVVKIYGKTKNDKIKELLILVKELENEIEMNTMVYIDGNLDLKDLGKIANGEIKMKKGE